MSAKFGVGDRKSTCKKFPMPFRIWQTLKRPHLTGGHATLFSRKDGQIQLGKLDGLKDIGPAEESADGTYQGMIIP
jgi:hypothetical protein